MKYLIAIILFCVLAFGQFAGAEEKKDITGSAGTQFHPELVKVFTRIMDKRIVEEMQEKRG